VSKRSWRLVRAGEDAVPDSARRFAARARRHRLRAAAPWLAALAVLALLGGLTAVVYGTSAFGVRKIRVQGTSVATVDEVRAAAAIRSGTPLARVDLDKVAVRVTGVPAVRAATVTRVWPDMLLIRVIERTAVAAVPAQGRFLLVDGDGVAYTSASMRPAHLPLVKLTAPDSRDPTTRAALTVLASLSPRLRELLVELVAESPTRIRLVLADERTIVWGDATENQAKVRVLNSLLDSPAKVIDVSAPSVVTVK
jgi:cell division protein FtsQ